MEVDVYIDYQNLFAGIAELGYSRDPKTLMNALKTEIVRYGRDVHFKAYADWGIIRRDADWDIQREFAKLDVDTFYEIVNPADHGKTSLTEDLLKKSRARVVILCTHKRDDIASVLDGVKKQGKRIVLIGINGGIRETDILSRDLSFSASDLIYIDKYLNVSVRSSRPVSIGKAKESNRPKRLISVPTISWKIRATTFLGIFGVIWLLIEPLAAFGSFPGLSTSANIAGYLVLLGISGLLTLLFEFVNRNRLISKMDFWNLTIILIETGTRYAIQVPKDMQIAKMLQLFLMEVSRTTSPNSRLFHVDLYDVSLYVKRGEKYTEVDSKSTLDESIVVDGDECRMIGKIKKEHGVVMFTRKAKRPRA